MSHGFIRYRIQPKSNLTVGDSITNFAAIYFDFNDPVITNDAITKIVLLTSLNDNASANILNGEVKLYPNPAKDEITIEWKNTKNTQQSVELFNVFGQQVKSISSPLTTNSTQNQTLNISNLASGVYFVKIEEVNVGKFVK